jgi:hypothetical protein
MPFLAQRLKAVALILPWFSGQGMPAITAGRHGDLPIREGCFRDRTRLRSNNQFARPD